MELSVGGGLEGGGSVRSGVGFKPDGSSSDANMLSFSSPYSFPQMPAVPPKNTGYYNNGGGYVNGGGGGGGGRCPFTASQWGELEQQALIYKYITANEPIPAHLLTPIRKALHSAAFFAFCGGALRPTAWGWSPYHLGYASSTDPEPGRCRRTDGKKWRCARDAVPDQKYCERHINRGRHRSRKHVEGQANSATTAIKAHTPSAAASASSSSAAAASLSTSFHSASNPAMNRMTQGLEDTSHLSFLSLSGSNANQNYSESGYSAPPKHHGSNEEFTITTSQNCGDGLNSTDGSSILWPGLQLQSDTNQQLSNFMSSAAASSPTDYDKAAFLPFQHSHQLEMGLGVGAQSYSNSQASWISSSWEPTAMGGPLGEALQSNSGAHREGKTASALNLLPKGWDGMQGSYQLSSSSPTGVLQRSALVSLSNSSAGSSPRADNCRTTESGGSLYNDLK